MAGTVATSLNCGPLGEVPYLSWDEHAKLRDGLSPETFADKFPHKEPVAFYDRNCLAETCDRQVLIVRGQTVVYIFDANGEPIDEPDDGVARGVQNIHGDDNSFVSDWKETYYSLPTVAQKAATATGFASVKSSLVAGKRVAVAFGDAATQQVSWYGGQIFQHCSATDTYMVGFDDGDYRAIPEASMSSFYDASCLRFPSDDEGGIVENVTGAPMVARIAHAKEGRAAQPSVVGVLVGSTKYKLAQETIYQSFCVHKEAKPAIEETAQGKTRSGGVSQKHMAKGLNSYWRGNVVERNVLEVEGETLSGCKAYVFGVTFREQDDGGPGAKYLVLMEPESNVFFVGMWTQWSRVHSGERSSWQADDDETAVKLTAEETATMLQKWEDSDKLVHLHNRTKVQLHARHISSKGPPHYEQQQLARTKAEKLQQGQEKKAARKARLTAFKKALQSRGRGRGRNGRGNARNGQKLADAPASTQPPNQAANEQTQDKAKSPRAPRDDLEVDVGGGLDQIDAVSLVDALTTDLGDRPDAAGVGGVCRLLPQRRKRIDEPEDSSPPLKPPRRSPRLSPPWLPPGWKTATSDAGQLYYYNKQLQVSQFHYPGTTAPRGEFERSPPMDAPKKLHFAHSSPWPAPAASSASTSASTSMTFFARQRRNQMARLQAMIFEAKAQQDSARAIALAGDLAMLESQAFDAGEASF